MAGQGEKLLSGGTLIDAENLFRQAQGEVGGERSELRGHRQLIGKFVVREEFRSRRASAARYGADFDNRPIATALTLWDTVLCVPENSQDPSQPIQPIIGRTTAVARGGVKRVSASGLWTPPCG
jgi:hypothetical protein